MARKKGIFGFGWGTILIGGGLIGSALAWHFHPPFRRALCNIGPIGTHFPLCKTEPGYVANENDLNDENMRGNITPGLSNEIGQALGINEPPTAAAFSRAYAGRRKRRFNGRLPKLKHSR